MEVNDTKNTFPFHFFFLFSFSFSRQVCHY
ncbi:hypothetical protein CAEBREN_25015 [Caenorhabditis brenneri]|uniref:Uncharacterized protein n=1 Tax=Caenorhabditis brenneri TaxID=135651 RepID=G0N5S3_CAEBE|nr:hypothetical protein CAEBREN_25015 [Caenorhabditis brenneri]